MSNLEQIRAVLAGMSDERFAWLVGHQPEPVAAELDRRTNLEALEAELASRRRKLALLPAAPEPLPAKTVDEDGQARAVLNPQG